MSLLADRRSHPGRMPGARRLFAAGTIALVITLFFTVAGNRKALQTRTLQGTSEPSSASVAGAESKSTRTTSQEHPAPEAAFSPTGSGEQPLEAHEDVSAAPERLSLFPELLEAMNTPEFSQLSRVLEPHQRFMEQQPNQWAEESRTAIQAFFNAHEMSGRLRSRIDCRGIMCVLQLTELDQLPTDAPSPLAALYEDLESLPWMSQFQQVQKVAIRSIGGHRFAYIAYSRIL